MNDNRQMVNPKLAPPVPGITANAGYVIRAVLPGHPAGNGLLESWWVAAEREGGEWVTWEAYALDGEQAGRLAYDAGHYYNGTAHPDTNRKAALADLAVRAGLTAGVALRIADDVLRRTDPEAPWASLNDNKDRAGDRRMARRLRAYFTR